MKKIKPGQSVSGELLWSYGMASLISTLSEESSISVMTVKSLLSAQPVALSAGGGGEGGRGGGPGSGSAAQLASPRGHNHLWHHLLITESCLDYHTTFNGRLPYDEYHNPQHKRCSTHFVSIHRNLLSWFHPQTLLLTLTDSSVTASTLGLFGKMIGEIGTNAWKQNDQDERIGLLFCGFSPSRKGCVYSKRRELLPNMQFLKSASMTVKANDTILS